MATVLRPTFPSPFALTPATPPPPSLPKHSSSPRFLAIFRHLISSPFLPPLFPQPFFFIPFLHAASFIHPLLYHLPSLPSIPFFLFAHPIILNHLLTYPKTLILAHPPSLRAIFYLPIILPSALPLSLFPSSPTPSSLNTYLSQDFHPCPA